MPDAPEPNAPHENPFRKWYAEHCSGREYRAFRTLAEAREQPDAIAVLDLEEDVSDPLATFPARRVEANPAALEQLHADLGALLACAMAPKTPDLEGRVRYESSASLADVGGLLVFDMASRVLDSRDRVRDESGERLDEMEGGTRLGGVVLHRELRRFELESEVEAVFLGVKAVLDPDVRRRVEAPEACPPHENQARKWYAAYCGLRRRYRAFQTLAEAREQPDAIAVLDLDADAFAPLATFPARRVEADPAALDRLHADLGALLASAMAPETPAVEGRVRYESSTILYLKSGIPRRVGLVLHESFLGLGLEPEVEAVFLGIKAALDSGLHRRIALTRAWWGAVVRGDVDAVRGLIDQGAPVGIVDRHGFSPLFCPIRNDDVAMVRLLLERGADPNQPDVMGGTPMARAAARASQLGAGYEDEILRLLIEAGGRLGFREAVILGDVGLARRLLDTDPTIDVSGDAHMDYSYSFLMVAASFGRLEMARFLLDRGADVHAVDNDIHYTALSIAAADGRADIAALLLDHGADPNHRDGPKHSPLTYAAEEGHRDVVRLLLDRGARPALVDAILLNDADLVAELLPTVEKEGVSLDSVLFHCRRRLARCDLGLVRVLLRGWTEGGGTLGPKILCEAAGEGRLDVVQLLLEYGCDPGEPDHSRGTPAEHAERAGHSEVAEFLRAAARDRRA